MSEDVLQLKFKIPDNSLSVKNLKLYIENNILDDVPREIDSSESQNFCMLHYAMGEFLSDTVVQTSLNYIEKHGGKEVRAYVWDDHTGDGKWGVIINNNLEYFDTENESLKAIAQQTVQQEKDSNINIFSQFKRSGDTDKAAIKLMVSGKKNIDNISRVFSILASNRNNLLEFEKEFESISKNKKNKQDITTETKWCKTRTYGPIKSVFKKTDDTEWIEGPTNIASGVEFVIIKGNELYMGLDLKGLQYSKYQNCENMVDERKYTIIMDNLLYVLLEINGVKKAWVRIDRKDGYFCGVWPVSGFDVPKSGLMDRIFFDWEWSEI